MPLLHHTVTGSAAPGEGPPKRLLVLHGIFGQGRNWATVASVLRQTRPDWEVVLVDLRLHGKSREGFVEPHDLRACAGDVAALAAALGGVRAVLGHSFGAKVTLAALESGGVTPGQAWIVDADPSAREPSGDAWEMLALLESLPASVPSRERFVAALLERGLLPPVAAWMATNLEPTEDGGVRLAFDLEGMEALLTSYFTTDLWGPVERPPCGLHVIRADASRVIDAAVLARFEAAAAATQRVHLHTVRGGHWINADNPSGVAVVLGERLP